MVLGDGISRALSGEVLRTVHALRSASLESVTEVVPSYASLTLFYDPALASFDALVDQVRPIVAATGSSSREAAPDSTRTIRIPVRYDGEDLDEIAERTGHSVREVIELHMGREYYVYVIGFVPGFAYLGDIDSSLVLPRRSAPRKRVRAGSVAIAETQTAVYPFATPGGWHILGTTDAPMFDAERRDPALLRVGDHVVFTPVE